MGHEMVVQGAPSDTEHTCLCRSTRYFGELHTAARYEGFQVY
ncbi:hypothetical protein AB8O55_24710 [Saccharopolyspora cebuensis]|uniref:Uncharacterized protein n=1 Tax=Saccharopolyspora cebuensis TaxID=418759 RepID=A0ABV4CNE1_9PSEU